MSKKIVFTGGGSAGHVTPNLSIIESLLDDYDEIHYIGGSGIEKSIISQYKNIIYHEITCAKLNRSLSLKNLTMPFNVLKGIYQSKKILKRLKPSIIFSKGGYVAVPVVLAGSRLHIPIIAHESDISMGLANKIIYKKCKKMCFSFPSLALEYSDKGIYTGSPIRKQLYNANKEKLKSKYFIKPTLPTILFFGGSLGAKAINETIFGSMPSLASKYNIIHIVGKNNINPNIHHYNYHQEEFVNNIQDYYAVSDMVICRAGSNSIFELLALNKPMILVPLPINCSRGDQIANAEYFQKNGYAFKCDQELFTVDNLPTILDNAFKQKNTLIKNQQKCDHVDGTKTIVQVIKNFDK